MRLSTRELQALHSIIGELDPAGCLYLYGSRADDARRGGDIDVYLQASHPTDLKTRLGAQYRLELELACDTRVDSPNCHGTRGVVMTKEQLIRLASFDDLTTYLQHKGFVAP